MYSYTQLEALWVSAGGNPTYQAMAAAIAMAESSGNPDATNNNGNGSIDRGLWQINSGHGSLSTFDPMGNARAAVQLSNGGSSWRAWCTAYSDGLCGTKGGTYLGKGSPFLKFLNGSTPTSNTNSTTPQTVATSTGPVPWYDWLLGAGESAAGANGLLTSGVPLGGISNTIESGIASGIMDVLKPVGRVMLHGLFVIGGVVIMAFGIVLMGKNMGMGAGIKQTETETLPEEKEYSYNTVKRRQNRDLFGSTQPETKAKGRAVQRKDVDTEDNKPPKTKRKGRQEKAEEAAKVAEVAA